MPSPFPGMNPYLEQEDVWHDFHERWIPAAAEAIERQIGEGFIVKIDQHIYIRELEADERALAGRGDVFVSQLRGEPTSETAVAEAPVAVALPHIDLERQSFIELVDRASRRIVVVVELLSPSNKRSGSDRDQYLAKRAALLSTPTHLVEIDLLRGGQPMPMSETPSCDYRMMVSLSPDRPKAGVWPIRLREPLPTIPIPLNSQGAKVQLDLQALLHEVYDAAGYRKYIYHSDPQPPLVGEDETWVRQIAESAAIGGRS